MKFLITETQYSRLFEQPDTKFDTPYKKELRRIRRVAPAQKVC